MYTHTLIYKCTMVETNIGICKCNFCSVFAPQKQNPGVNLPQFPQSIELWPPQNPPKNLRPRWHSETYSKYSNTHDETLGDRYISENKRNETKLLIFYTEPSSKLTKSKVLKIFHFIGVQVFTCLKVKQSHKTTHTRQKQKKNCEIIKRLKILNVKIIRNRNPENHLSMQHFREI